MRKYQILGLLVIALGILAITGCGSAPPPPPPAPKPAVVEQPQEGTLVLDGAANHTVVAGDTLANIAASNYGGSNMYFFPLIRIANAAAVPNPDEIEVGTNLVVPNLQRNLGNAGAVALIKADLLNTASLYESQGKPVAAQTLRDLAARY